MYDLYKRPLFPSFTLNAELPSSCSCANCSAYTVSSVKNIHLKSASVLLPAFVSSYFSIISVTGVPCITTFNSPFLFTILESLNSSFSSGVSLFHSESMSDDTFLFISRSVLSVSVGFLPCSRMMISSAYHSTFVFGLSLFPMSAILLRIRTSYHSCFAFSIW